MLILLKSGSVICADVKSKKKRDIPAFLFFIKKYNIIYIENKKKGIYKNES